MLSKDYLQLRFDFVLENRSRLLLGRHIADLNKAGLVLLGCGQRRKESGLGVRGPMANSIAADEERLLNRCEIMRLGLVQLVLIWVGCLRNVGPDIFDGEGIGIKKLILISLNKEILGIQMTAYNISVVHS